MKQRRLSKIVAAAVFSLMMCGAASVSGAEITELSPVYQNIRGDVNSDGKLNVFDYIRYQHILTDSAGTKADFVTDINGDGSINSADVLLLKNHILGGKKILTVSDMPVLDGSTSAIPLETGFKSALLGIPYNEASRLVNHNKTHESFSRLLSGENDMIFSVPISESQQAAADEAGVHLNMTPVAKESFVFVVNKNNPVDTLTQQQIKDIYSGRITNWKDVGGNDEKIIPYQRNKDSGSQNYMTEFMKDDTLMEAPVGYVEKVMGGLMDRIAIYDNSSSAIGYSVYSYAAQMYENSSDVKFIAVDGTAPSRETIADSSYPLVSYTYMMYRDSISEKTKNFIDWAVSDEGQQCAMRNGYLPVADIEYPDEYKLYNSAGTGKEMPEDYIPSRKYAVFTFHTEEGDMSCQESYQIDFLKDKEFEKQINSDILNLLESKGTTSDIKLNCEAVNGYMTVEVCFDKTRCYINYDLINRKKLEKFSDLFYKDTCFISEVNRNIQKKFTGSPFSEIMKTDFLGITGGIDEFSVNTVLLGDNNPYFHSRRELYYCYNYENTDLLKYMVTGEYNDMRDLISVCDADTNRYYISERNEWVTEYVLHDDGYIHEEIAGSAFHSKEETEKQAEIRRKIFADVIELNQIPESNMSESRLHISLYEGGWLFPRDDYRLNLYAFYYDDIGNSAKYRYSTETGERVSVADVFGSAASCIESFSDIEKIDTDKNIILYRKDDGSKEEIIYDPDEVNTSYLVKTDPEMPVSYELEDADFYGRISQTSSIYKYYDSELEMIHKSVSVGTRVRIKRKLHESEEHSYTIYYECFDAVSDKLIGWINERNILEIIPDQNNAELKDNLIYEYINVVSSKHYGEYEMMLYDVDGDGITELITDEDYVINIYSYSETQGLYSVAEIKYTAPSAEYKHGFDMYKDEKDGSVLLKTVLSNKYYKFENTDGMLSAVSLDYPGNAGDTLYNISTFTNMCKLSSDELTGYFENAYIHSQYNYFSDNKYPTGTLNRDTVFYTQKYIQYSGEPEILNTIKNDTKVSITSTAASLGKIWGKCFDEKSGKYLGWADISDITGWKPY